MHKICGPSVHLTKISFFGFIVQIMTRREGFLPIKQSRIWSILHETVCEHPIETPHSYPLSNIQHKTHGGSI